MKTYLKKDHKGFYVNTIDEIDSTLWAGQTGTTYEDFQNNKWILLSNEQIAFKEAHPGISVKNVIEMTEPQAYQRTLEDAKNEKLTDIQQYDESDNVNSFNVAKDGIVVSAWLTPSERANYRSSIDAAELMGVENLSLYIGDMPITLPTATAKLMLALILLYADGCFIVTEQHKAAVEALDSIEAVDAYDYTQGYPTKLDFTYPIQVS